MDRSLAQLSRRIGRSDRMFEPSRFCDLNVGVGVRVPGGAPASKYAAAVGRIKKLAPSVLLMPGDFVKSGGLASQWNDSSGNSRHAAQGSGTSQPVPQTYGTLVFGSPKYMQIPGWGAGQPVTIYMRGRQTAQTVGASSFFYDGLANVSGSLSYAASSSVLRVNSTTVAGVSSIVGAFFTSCVVFNGAASSLNIDGVITALSVTNSMNGATLGCAGSIAAYGSVEEAIFIMYPAAHDVQTQSQMLSDIGTVTPV